ncbi:DUF1816 domain-containing protein [Pleurocapsales cyanobacterium LEGE 10410]|nr:DUF1816 domain-containing protein [Pleurocapsales cyanobacterium LEGE 10410]
MSYYNSFSTACPPYNRDNKSKRQFPWWVKIATAKPQCVYYFGPFDNQSKAVKSQSGYLEDLSQEQAKVVSIEIKQEQPKLLTIPPE